MSSSDNGPRTTDYGQVLVLAMTGASGSAYALRLLEVLLGAGCRVHLTISPAAVEVLRTEIGIEVDPNRFDAETLLVGGRDEALPTPRPALRAPRSALVYHHYRDFSAGIASGSFRTDGMVICPCSMGTLAGVAHGLSSNLIQRAADVHLKERRKLIVVPRETPLGSIQLENMKRLADAGAVILPAMPAFYHRPQSIADLVDFVVNRICDQLGVRLDLFPRWGQGPGVRGQESVVRTEAGTDLSSLTPDP